MHIGIITHNYPGSPGRGSNAGLFVADFAHALKKYRQVSVLSLAPNDDQQLGRWTLTPRSVLAYYRFMRESTRKADAWVKRKKIDFILAMWALPAGLVAGKLYKKFGIPYAVWALGSDVNVYAHIPVLRGFMRRSLIHAHVRFANSYALKRTVEALCGLPCPFLPAATTLPKPTHIDLSNKLFHFLFVGRLEKVKGLDVLLNATRILSQETEPFMVHIIGRGSMENWAREYVLQHELTEVIAFHEVNRATLAGYYKASDCLVTPSRNESMPLVILEAASLGLPCIGTDVGDIKQMLAGYRTGIVVKKNDPRALAHAMKQALGRRKSFRKDYERGLAAIRRHYTVSRSVRGFVVRLAKPFSIKDS